MLTFEQRHIWVRGLSSWRVFACSAMMIRKILKSEPDENLLVFLWKNVEKKKQKKSKKSPKAKHSITTLEHWEGGESGKRRIIISDVWVNGKQGWFKTQWMRTWEDKEKATDEAQTWKTTTKRTEGAEQTPWHSAGCPEGEETTNEREDENNKSATATSPQL